MGGAYEALDLNVKLAVGMLNWLALKINERGEVVVKPRRHVFVPKVRTEERIMEFLKRYTGWKNHS